MLQGHSGPNNRLQHRAATLADLRQVPPEVLRPHLDLHAAQVHPQPEEGPRGPEAALHQHPHFPGRRHGRQDELRAP